MTGGVAFILDDEAWLDGANDAAAPLTPFANVVNKETVTLVRLGPGFAAARRFLEETLQNHVSETGSRRAKRVLDSLATAMGKITMVVPASEKSNALVQEDATSSVSSSSSVKA